MGSALSFVTMRGLLSLLMVMNVAWGSYPNATLGSYPSCEDFEACIYLDMLLFTAMEGPPGMDRPLYVICYTYCPATDFECHELLGQQGDLEFGCQHDGEILQCPYPPDYEM